MDLEVNLIQPFSESLRLIFLIRAWLRSRFGEKRTGTSFTETSLLNRVVAVRVILTICIRDSRLETSRDINY
jgi:hypothetical protein